MPDYIALYRAYLEQEKHASPNTVSSYVRDLTQFRAWLPQGSALARGQPAPGGEFLAHRPGPGPPGGLPQRPRPANPPGPGRPGPYCTATIKTPVCPLHRRVGS